MDRQVFLAARPWLHAVGEAGSCTAGSEDELHSATAYEFKLQRLFAGVCCLHLLPLPPGALVTPDTHFLFFEPTAGADPAQLRLELWVAAMRKDVSNFMKEIWLRERLLEHQKVM